MPKDRPGPRRQSLITSRAEGLIWLEAGPVGFIAVFVKRVEACFQSERAPFDQVVRRGGKYKRHADLRRER